MSDTVETRDEWKATWLQTFGKVPPSIQTMHEFNEVVEGAYRQMRTWYYQERADGLPTAVKELLMVVIDVIVGQAEGAGNHLRAGIDDGLTLTQVQEALTACFMVRGINTFGTVGHHVWTEASERLAPPS